MSDGAVRQYGNLSAPRLILSHGNGCAIDGYFPYWERLLPVFEVVVFDFRNSGINPVHDGDHGYERFMADMSAV